MLLNIFFCSGTCEKDATETNKDIEKLQSLNINEVSSQSEDKEAIKAENAESTDSSDQPDPEMVWFRDYVERHTGGGPPPEKVLDTVDLNGVIKLIKEGKVKNIITMAGAGISTSAGIPDFRTPGTGLYDNLQKYNLPDPQAIFTLDYFKENPAPFFTLAKELFPGQFKPTPCHYFIKMLADKGLLLRHFTQNIDTLEMVAGMDPDKVIEAHGSFKTGRCLNCRKLYMQDWMKKEIFADKIPKCIENKCNGIVKPDITFFGERLSVRFAASVSGDFPKCDLLIILGTSLVVHPFASLPARVPDSCPRLYINKEKSGNENTDPLMALFLGGGFKFDDKDNYRDIFFPSSCDEGCMAFADGLGWGEKLRKQIKMQHSKIDRVSNLTSLKSGRPPAVVKKSPTKAKDSFGATGKTGQPSTLGRPTGVTDKKMTKPSPSKMSSVKK